MYNDNDMDKMFNVSLPVNILREGDKFVAYTPALELSTEGNTFEEAKKNFEEAVLIFFEEITQERKTEDALSNLGWMRVNTKFVPPTMVSAQSETFSVPLMQ